MTYTENFREPDGVLLVRTYQPQDQAAVTHLYTAGLLLGQIAPNDTGADVENISEAYLTDPRNHFWIAQLNQSVVGMIGVAAEENNTAEVRRLRVDKAFQDTTIVSKLIETAINHCRRHGYLKVVFDTHFEHSMTVNIFTHFGFHHTRTKNYHGRDALEFYLDLYSRGKSANE